MVNDNHMRIGKNKIDPLTDTSGESGKVLFDRLNKQCKDFPLEAVVNGSSNVLLNVIRQRNATRDAAEKDFNEMFGRLKAILMEHYNGPDGKRRSVFPFHQTISPPFLDFVRWPKRGMPPKE
jgi:hypothetical protein